MVYLVAVRILGIRVMGSNASVQGSPRPSGKKPGEPREPDEEEVGACHLLEQRQNDLYIEQFILNLRDLYHKDSFCI